MFQQVNALVHTHLLMALMQGRVPVVDMQTEKNQYLAADKVGRENSWEYFFEQPYGIGLSSVPSGADVECTATSARTGASGRATRARDFGMRDETAATSTCSASASCARTTSHCARSGRSRMPFFSPGDTVLGIVIRETDYALQMEHHSPADGQVDYTAQIRDALRRHGCDAIFVATESGRVFDSISAAFPGSRGRTRASSTTATTRTARTAARWCSRTSGTTGRTTSTSGASST